MSLFSPNTGKYGVEKTLYLDTFHAMEALSDRSIYYTCKIARTHTKTINLKYH